MKLYFQVAILFIFSIAGEAIKQLAHLPIPGSIVGILLLFLALKIGWIKPEDIHDVCQFLLDNLTILFVPAGVALMNYYDAIKNVWPILLLTVIFCSIMTMVSIGWITQWTEKFIMKRPTSLLLEEEEELHS